MPGPIWTCRQKARILLERLRAQVEAEDRRIGLRLFAVHLHCGAG
jgi:hypothetical protein